MTSSKHTRALCASLGSLCLFSGIALAQPVSLWHGEGSPADSVGPNPFVPHSVSYAPGQVGQEFNLPGGYLDIPAPAVGGLISPSGFTVMAFIHFNTWTPTASTFNLRTPANSAGFTVEPLFGSADTMAFYLNTDGTPGGYTGITSTGWATNESYHLTVTFDAAAHRTRMYRDGILVASGTTPNTTMSTDPALVFQVGRNIVNGTLMNGGVDEVAFYNRELSDTEVNCAMLPGLLKLRPQDTSVCLGNTAQLSVTTRGTATPTYQWRHAGTPISLASNPTAHSATLTISNAGPADAGTYDCIIAAPCGPVTSITARLFVNSADFNNDGDTGTDADIEAFFACLGGNCCPTCGSADFNGDADVGTDADIESFFRVLSGGPC